MKAIVSLTMIALTTLHGNMALGSSHREAPAVAQDAPIDITDFYVFKAGGERSDSHVAFVLNVYPGQLASGAPNWYRFADDARYEIHIDNNGDAKADMTYRFEFDTRMLEGDGAAAPIAYLPGMQFANGRYQSNLSQTYTMTKIMGRDAQVIAKAVPVAPPRIGPFTTDVEDPANPLNFNSKTKTDPKLADQKYAAFAALAEKDAGDYRMFAGPRNDPFYVDLGGVFDGLNVRVPGISGTPVDALKGLNVLSIVIEIPRADFLKDGQAPIFGTWATTSRRQNSFRRVAGGQIDNGGWVQVGRLGNPLVNEVVIGFKDKDGFNAGSPADDAANYAGYVLEPTLAALLNQLYGKGDAEKGIAPGVVAPILENFSATNRTDLVQAFVTGIPNVNEIPGRTGTGDMIRMNLNLEDGWPVSGRKLDDNVVKSALTFLAECKVLPDYNNLDISGIWANHTKGADTINCALSDGLSADDKTLGGAGQTDQFPYVGMPHSSYGVRGGI